MRYHRKMRFRLGLALGFGAGYYLGAKAGRERYEQIRSALARLRGARPVEKLRAGAELAAQRVRSRPPGSPLSDVGEPPSAPSPEVVPAP